MAGKSLSSLKDMATGLKVNKTEALEMRKKKSGHLLFRGQV